MSRELNETKYNVRKYTTWSGKLGDEEFETINAINRPGKQVAEGSWMIIITAA